VVGKAFIRAFSRARVLAWKRGPFCVYPVYIILVSKHTLPIKK
jgi:hypothetical protein